jgi:hypothetical protein
LPGSSGWLVELAIARVRAALRDCSGAATIFWVDSSVVLPMRNRTGWPSPRTLGAMSALKWTVVPRFSRLSNSFTVRLWTSRRYSKLLL